MNNVRILKIMNLNLPFSYDFGIGDWRRAHKLWDKVAENSDENHDHGERNQHPISDGSVEN